MRHTKAPLMLTDFLKSMRHFIQNKGDLSSYQGRLNLLDFVYNRPIPADQLPADFQKIISCAVLPHDVTDHLISPFLSDRDITEILDIKEQLQQIAKNDFLFYALLQHMFSICQYLGLDLMDHSSPNPKNIMSHIGYGYDADQINHAPSLAFKSFNAICSFPLPNKLLSFDRTAWEKNDRATILTLLNDIINPETWKGTHQAMRQQYYIPRILLFIGLVLFLIDMVSGNKHPSHDTAQTVGLGISSAVLVILTFFCSHKIPIYDGEQIRILKQENHWLNTGDGKICLKGTVQDLQPSFYALFQQKKAPTSNVPSMVTTLNDDGLDERLLDRRF